jgi:hypothetical protein
MRRGKPERSYKRIWRFKQALYPNRTPSPRGSEERDSNPPTPFKQRYASYKSFDPSQPFAHYAGTSHMGFHSQLGGDFGQQGLSSTAPPPPPPEQPRKSNRCSLCRKSGRLDRL